MGAVAVDGSGAIWWIDDAGRLRRRGDAAVMREGAQAIAIATSGPLVLDRDGGLGPVAGPAVHDLVPAADVAVDEGAGIAYLAAPGAVIARSLRDGTSGTVAAIDAAALVLAPDRRRLFVADRGSARIVVITTHGSDAGTVEATVALDAAPVAVGISGPGLVVATADAVLGLNLRHHSRAVLHAPGSAPALVAARGIAAGRDRRALWVADGARLIAVATDGTGARVDT